MKLEQWLKQASGKLKKSGIGTADLDALVLLEDELQIERSRILAYPEKELSATQIAKLSKRVVRRAKHEPLAYIRGFTEFYGRRFKVNRHVLEPRPESETMIDLLKQLKLPKKTAIADVGTGSGALGITAGLELHNHEVDLYDIDAWCLAVAKHNCALHELHLHVRKSDLLSRRLRSYDVVLANLPYVPKSWNVDRATNHEPKLAWNGGSDGLEIYKRLFKQFSHYDKWPKYVLTEALPPQQDGLAGIARQNGYKELKKQDFIQLFRLI